MLMTLPQWKLVGFFLLCTFAVVLFVNLPTAPTLSPVCECPDIAPPLGQPLQASLPTEIVPPGRKGDEDWEVVPEGDAGPPVDCDSANPDGLLPKYPQQPPCIPREPRANLPRCTKATEIMRGRWNPSHDWFEPEGCNIKKFTPEEAGACLAGKTIGFIGDSTIAGIWRDTRSIFGEDTTLYGENFNEEELKKNRKPGDPKLSFLTTFYHPEHQFLFRHYTLWKLSMLHDLGIEGRDMNHSISSVVHNMTHDLIIINIGAHHEPENVLEGVVPMVGFYQWLDRVVRKGETPPVLYISTNAQLGEKRSDPKRRFQGFHYARVLNELAQQIFEQQEPRVVPMLDYSHMIERGFPWSSADGIHNVALVNHLKWHIILNYLCTEEGFNTNIQN